MSTCIIMNNTSTAVQQGGGLHAISSSMKAISAFTNVWLQYTGTRINFTKNLAKRGGGLSLEANAKLYVLKHDNISTLLHNSDGYNTNTTIFTANRADYGGAVYVDDTNSGTCASEPKTECFFQVLAIHGLEENISRHRVYISHKTMLLFQVPLSMEDY